jgi:folate-binding protein YgfZ
MTNPVMGEVRGASVARHFGDPPAEWMAATTSVAVRDRSHRLRWTVTGRQPSGMLLGVVTGHMPGPWTETDAGVGRGRAEYSAVLTPKGRTVSDLRLWRDAGEDGEAAALMLDVPVAGGEALEAHLRRFLPPRLARVSDVTASTGMLTVLGPEAADWIAREATGLRLERSDLEALAEGDLLAIDLGGERALVVVRSGEVSEVAWDLVGSADDIDALRRRVEATEATWIGSGVWEALRLEAGRPAFGAELSEEVIPVEAGIHHRAIDYDKGCYTGQEVIVRIRDRGRVNRHLRRLRLPDGPLPAPGTELWNEPGDKAVGAITSVATSPRRGPLALGYVRREVEPPGPVRVGSAEGPTAEVEALAD